MPFVPAICPQCGDRIKVDDSLKTGKCPSCGCEFVMEQAITSYNNYVTNNVNNTIESAVFSNHDTIDELIERFNAVVKLIEVEGDNDFKIDDYESIFGAYKSTFYNYAQTYGYFEQPVENYLKDNENFQNLSEIIERMKKLYPHLEKTYLYVYYFNVIKYEIADAVCDYLALKFTSRYGEEHKSDIESMNSQLLATESKYIRYFKNDLSEVEIEYKNEVDESKERCFAMFPDAEKTNSELLTSIDSRYIKVDFSGTESILDGMSSRILQAYNVAADREKCEAKKNKRKSRLKMFLFFFIVPVFAILSIVLAATVDGIVTTILGVIGILVLIGYAGAIWGLIKHK